MVFTLTEALFATTSYSFEFFFFWSLNMQVRSINYLLHFDSDKIHKHYLYWRVFSTDITRKNFFKICYFFSYVFWSINCVSWVSKFNIFFLTYTETEAIFTFDGFNIALCEKFISNSPIVFSHFFSGLQIVQGTFSATLWVSKLYELRLWIIEHVFEMASN